MYTLEQFRKITEHLPGDFEIRLEASFTPKKTATVPCFEIITSQHSKQVVLMPQAVYISDGKTGLTVQHKEGEKKK